VGCFFCLLGGFGFFVFCGPPPPPTQPESPSQKSIPRNPDAPALGSHPDQTIRPSLLTGYLWGGGVVGLNNSDAEIGRVEKPTKV